MTLEATFTFEMDGHMAEVIINALHDKARSQECDIERYKHLILAKKVKDAKQSFHDRTYDVMAIRYGLPAREVNTDVKQTR